MKNSVLLLLQKVVSPFVKILDIDDAHVKIILLGFIKFSLLKLSLRRRIRQVNKEFEYYKKHVDITQVPKATGIVRQLQLIQIHLLKEIDYVCKEAGFDYWIDFGTLLGAVRHKGFIPWDDDVDLGMPREFYDKFIETFNSKTRNPNLIALYPRKDHKARNCFIKVRCGDSKFAIDIFPYDFYGETLSKEKQQELTLHFKKCREDDINKIVDEKGLSNDEILSEIHKLRKKLLVNGECTKESVSDLVWGVDFYHLWEHWFFNYEVFYPLREIEFEGLKLPCCNKYDEYLKTVYGDYMAYPKNAMHSHQMYRFTENRLQEIKKLLQEEQK